MDEIPQPPSVFRVDFNGDARYTITDFLLWLQDAFFLPGDWLIWTVATYAPRAAAFLELGAADYGGVLSGFVSALAWIALLLSLGTLLTILRNADRALTSGIGAAHAEGRRRMRVTAALLRYRLRGAMPERKAGDLVELSEEVELDAQELGILRLHADLEPGQALAEREVAAKLELGGREARRALAKLERLNLLERDARAFKGNGGYRLAQAGRAFLVFRQLAGGSAPKSG